MSSQQKTIEYLSPSIGPVRVEFFVGAQRSAGEIQDEIDQAEEELTLAREQETFFRCHNFYLMYPRFLANPSTWTRRDVQFLGKAREAIPTLDLHPIVCDVCGLRNDLMLEEEMRSPEARQHEEAFAARGQLISGLPGKEVDSLFAELVRHGFSEKVVAHIKENVACRAPIFIRTFAPVAQ